MFEAIQRVMDPPEMDTHQLLTVSVVGLLINLFGMWATGGHHHHGHHHGDSHGHGHGHSHSIAVHEKKVSEDSRTRFAVVVVAGDKNSLILYRRIIATRMEFDIIEQTLKE